MSSANSISTPAQSKRRVHARRRIEGLIYVDLGPDNGAILIDLGEGGLGFQSAVPVGLDDDFALKFKLPGATDLVEGSAEVAWLNESGKSGGLRFVELNPEARAQIHGFAAELAAPQPEALPAENGAEPQRAHEIAIEASSAQVTDATAAPEASRATTSEATNTATPQAPQTEDTPAQISETSPAAESAQPLSPHTPKLAIDAVALDGLATESAHHEVPAVPSATPTVSVSEIGEFLMELTAHAGEDLTAPPPSIDFDPAPPLVPASSTRPDDAGAPEPALSDKEPRAAEVASEAAPSGNSTKAASEVAKTSSDEETGAAIRPAPEIGVPPVNSDATPSEVSVKPSGVRRTPQLSPEIPQRVAAPHPKPPRPQPSDARNLAQAPKPRKPASAKPEPSVPAYRPDSAARGSFSQKTGQMGQSAKPAPLSTESQNLLDAQDDFKPPLTLSSQVLKIAIGAGAGACLVLVLVFAIPYLRTLVQTTANARSAALNLANAPAFQVEVADLNNRRWILRSGGDAGSPFTDSPSRRETQSNPSNAGRKESAKSSRSDESADSAETPAEAQPKLAKPSELALSRPVPKPADATAAQPLAPSIFDGITPPIGSLADRLPQSGPDLPGIVEPASPTVKGPSALQSAVLLQRVAPIYPADALAVKVQGEVTVSATIGKDGVPKDLKVIKGDQRLIGAAFTAIRQWRYRPATLGGIPVETQATVTVAFELK